MRIVLLVALLAGCSGNWRASVMRTANVVIAAANSAGELLVKQYCAESMQAIGRTGTWTLDGDDTGHCVESGPRAGTPATAQEIAALAQVRARWKPVRQAQTDLESAHTVLQTALSPDAVAKAAEAYGAAALAARSVGIDLPKLQVSQ